MNRRHRHCEEEEQPVMHKAWTTKQSRDFTTNLLSIIPFIQQIASAIALSLSFSRWYAPRNDVLTLAILPASSFRGNNGYPKTEIKGTSLQQRSNDDKAIPCNDADPNHKNEQNKWLTKNYKENNTCFNQNIHNFKPFNIKK